MKPEYEPKNWQDALAHAMEEMGEAIQACGKTQRFGPLGFNPEIPESEREYNFEFVHREFQDVRKALKRAELMLAEHIKRRREYIEKQLVSGGE